MTRPYRLSEAGSRALSDNAKRDRLSESGRRTLSEKATQQNIQRWNRTKAAQWLQRLENSKAGHDADEIDGILSRIQDKFKAGGVVLNDKVITEIKERVLARSNGHNEPTRPTPAQRTTSIKPEAR